MSDKLGTPGSLATWRSRGLSCPRAVCWGPRASRAALTHRPRDLARGGGPGGALSPEGGGGGGGGAAAPAGAGDAPACFCERWPLTYGNDARAGPQSRPLEGRVPGSAARAARCRGASGALTKRPFLAELRRQLALALPRGRRKVGEAGGAGPPVWACELRDRGWAGGAGTPRGLLGTWAGPPSRHTSASQT